MVPRNPSIFQRFLRNHSIFKRFLRNHQFFMKFGVCIYSGTTKFIFLPRPLWQSLKCQSYCVFSNPRGASLKNVKWVGRNYLILDAVVSLLITLNFSYSYRIKFVFICILTLSPCGTRYQCQTSTNDDWCQPSDFLALEFSVGFWTFLFILTFVIFDGFSLRHNSHLHNQW